MKRKSIERMVQKIPSVNKSINDFILSEEGNISKKDIAKLGISLAILGLMLQPGSADASHNNSGSHSNAAAYHASTTNPSSSQIGYHSSNGVSHGSHANHTNHGNGGGWC